MYVHAPCDTFQNAAILRIYDYYGSDVCTQRIIPKLTIIHNRRQ